MFKKQILSIFLSCFMIVGISKAQNFEISSLGLFSYNDILSSQKLSDVWGYASDGKEYALVGLWDGFSVLDITNPVNIVEKTRISGPNSIWRDIKTWSHYAYISHDNVHFSSPDTAVGLLIVDLNTLDSNTVDYTTFNYAGNMNRIHNIYIDENGILYAFGADYGEGGALMFDLEGQEMTPSYVGEYDSTYLHDGFARGDTLWGNSIYEGEFLIMDVTDKMNPEILGSQTTPNTFSHNCWPSDDNKYLFTTDEVVYGSVAAYDVSDVSNIQAKGLIQSSFSTGTIPHNTHFYDNFLINSYYRDGLQIVDVSRPEMMVEVGRYDSSPSYMGGGFNGAWGAYPFLPSTRVLISDMEEGLSIVQPSYQRAAFYEGVVIDISTNLVLDSVEINLNEDTLLSGFNGDFLFGQKELGQFNVEAKLDGYNDFNVQILMVEGQTLLDTIFMEPIGFGILELDQLISIYPNPVKDVLFIESSDIEISSFSIYSIDGAKVVESIVGIESNKLNVSNLPKGIYLIDLYTKEGYILNKKFTKL